MQRLSYLALANAHSSCPNSSRTNGPINSSRRGPVLGSPLEVDSQTAGGTQRTSWLVRENWQTLSRWSPAANVRRVDRPTWRVGGYSSRSKIFNSGVWWSWGPRSRRSLLTPCWTAPLLINIFYHYDQFLYFQNIFYRKQIEIQKYKEHTVAEMMK